MFNNIGGKIKGLAIFLTILGIISSIVIGIVIISTMASSSYTRAGGIIIGLLVMVLGSVVSWVSSFLLFGFGQLVESAQNIEREITGQTDDGEYETESNPVDLNYISSVKKEPNANNQPTEYNNTPQSGTAGLLFSDGVLTCASCGSVVEPGDSKCSSCKKQIDWNNVTKQ